MRLAIQTLAVALLALLSVTPTAATAGKKNQDPAAFSVDIHVSGRWTDWFYAEGTFRSTGAIADSGRAFMDAFHYFELTGEQTSYVVNITTSPDDPWVGTFEIREWPWTGYLIGTGTATGSISGRVAPVPGSLVHIRWRLDGMLVDG